ncbi:MULTISPECIES: hypothetical protein [unclassified Methanoculleus]|uniref:hypothetical protein n=1 Tax=unclassified Methanoculleus TaxID=2619537 RepID=UPI00319E4832
MRHLIVALLVGAARNRIAFSVRYLDDGHCIILAHGGKTAVPIPATVENARLRAGVLPGSTGRDDGGCGPVRPNRTRGRSRGRRSPGR